MKHPVVFTRNARRVAVLAAGGLTGCLSRPSLQKERFAFPVPPREPGRGKWVLELRAPRVAAPMDSQSFLYRTGDYAYERDPYAEFLAPPAAALRPAIRGWLENSPKFGGITDSGSDGGAELALDIYVSELSGDFRRREAPAAVLRMNFVFSDRSRPGQI